MKEKENILTEQELLDLAKKINSKELLLSKEQVKALANSFANSSELNRIKEDSKRFK